jgi:DNA-directed RNA polymerase specialized sigma24 family protein
MSTVESKLEEEDLAVFDARFGRSYPMLQYIARRILGDPERAEKAIENCRITASRNPPRFQYGGAFKSWIFKVLIHEVLALLPESQQTP